MAARFNKGVNASRSFWLLIAGASLVPALLNAFTTYLTSRFVGRGGGDWGAVAFAGALWLVFGALTPITYVLARRYPVRREAIGRTILVHLTGALVLCIAWSSAGVFLALLLNRSIVKAETCCIWPARHLVRN